MDSYSYYFLFPKYQTHAYTKFENGCSKNSPQNLLTKYSTEEKNKFVICWPRSVRIGKNCALGLEYSRPLAQFFPTRTTRPANNIYVFIYIKFYISVTNDVIHLRYAHKFIVFMITIFRTSVL